MGRCGLLFTGARALASKGLVRGDRVICFPMALQPCLVILGSECSLSLTLKMPHSPESTKQLKNKKGPRGLISAMVQKSSEIGLLTLTPYLPNEAHCCRGTDDSETMKVRPSVFIQCASCIVTLFLSSDCVPVGSAV